ncbi:hypothetical protein ACET9K_16320 [Aeromonas enteropelogenes]
MSIIYNPAQELLDVISKATKPNNAGRSARLIWLDVFGLPEYSVSELYGELSRVINLPNEIRRVLEEINFPVDTIEPSLGRIIHIFSTMDFNTPGSTLTQYLDNSIQLNLKQVSWNISHPNMSAFTPKEITTLEELLSELKALFEAASNINEVPQELRLFLDVYISDLISSIEEYLTTRDITELKKTTTSAITVLGLERDVLEAAQKNEAGIKFRTILMRLMELIGYGNELKQLSDNILLLSDSL